MSTDLEQFREHARFMAGREHAPDCPPVRSKPGRAHRYDGRKWCGTEATHEPHEWRQKSPLSDRFAEWRCEGYCTGCAVPGDVALWLQIADEIDAYLGTETADDETLEGL